MLAGIVALFRRARLLAAVMLAAVGAACATEAKPAARVPAEAFGGSVDKLATDYMKARGVPGMAVAVIADGRVVKRGTYGLASVELNAPVTNKTLFTMASTSKEFTAVGIMKLVEEGRVRLDQPVREILPELPESWSAVTVRHCLSHTSGLPDTTTPDTVNIIPVAGEKDTLMRMLAQQPMLAEPGAVSSYNGTGVLLLSMIIEKVSQQRYEAFIADAMLKPLGIKGMAFGDSWDVILNRASSYTALKPDAKRERVAIQATGQPIFEPGKVYAFGSKGFPDWMNPAAGINASLEAMIAWESALWSGRVVKPATLVEMSKPYELNDGKSGGFGLALIPGQYKGMQTVSSGGGAAVWVTTIPEKKLTVIVLTNLQGSFPQNFITQVFDSYLVAN